jgi:dihydroorotase
LLHCEDETTIKNNLAKIYIEYGEDIPVTAHHLIRSEEALYLIKKAVALAKKTGSLVFTFRLPKNGLVYQ